MCARVRLCLPLHTCVFKFVCSHVKEEKLQSKISKQTFKIYSLQAEQKSQKCVFLSIYSMVAFVILLIVCSSHYSEYVLHLLAELHQNSTFNHRGVGIGMAAKNITST